MAESTHAMRFAAAKNLQKMSWVIRGRGFVVDYVEVQKHGT